MYCCYESLQNFSISCVDLNIECVTQVCPKRKYMKVLLMLVKYGACHAKTSCYVYFCVNACVLAKEVVLEKKCFTSKMACSLSILLSSFNR